MYDQHLYDRLVARIRKDEATGCWLWTGPYSKNRPWPQNRYGYLTVPKQYSRSGKKHTCTGTHRAMLMALFGPLRPDQCACHRCDVPLCINPDHLFIGSMGDNIRDSRSKNRHHEGKKDFCERGHALFGDNVRIGQQHPPKTGIRRTCKVCELGHIRVGNGWPEDLAYNPTIKVPKGYKLDFVTLAVVPCGRGTPKRQPVSAGENHG